MKLISFDETNDNNNKTINNAMTKKQKHTELCILFFSDRDEGDSKITIDTGSHHIASERTKIWGGSCPVMKNNVT